MSEDDAMRGGPGTGRDPSGDGGCWGADPSPDRAETSLGRRHGIFLELISNDGGRTFIGTTGPDPPEVRQSSDGGPGMGPGPGPRDPDGPEDPRELFANVLEEPPEVEVRGTVGRVEDGRLVPTVPGCGPGDGTDVRDPPGERGADDGLRQRRRDRRAEPPHRQGRADGRARPHRDTG